MLLLIFWITDYTIDIQKVIDFANYLYKKSEYKASITEYKRALFLGSKFSYKDTLSIFLQLGKAYYLLGDYKKSYSYLELVKNDTSYMIMGFCELEQRNLHTGKKNFDRVKNKEWQEKIKFYYSKLSQLSYKSPIFAGLFSSVIPGTGRVYCKRLGDGISSFIFTVGSFFIAYRYYNKNNMWAAGGFLGIGLFFYLGNIYGSVEACRLYNKKIFYDELDKFEDEFNYIY